MHSQSVGTCLRSMTFSSLPNTSSTDAQSGADVAGGFVAATIDFMNWSYAECWRVVYECPRAAMEGEDLILHARLEQARKELKDLKERQKKMITSYSPDDKRKRQEHLRLHLAWINTSLGSRCLPSYWCTIEMSSSRRVWSRMNNLVELQFIRA